MMRAAVPDLARRNARASLDLGTMEHKWAGGPFRYIVRQVACRLLGNTWPKVRQLRPAHGKFNCSRHLAQRVQRRGASITLDYRRQHPLKLSLQVADMRS